MADARLRVIVEAVTAGAESALSGFGRSLEGAAKAGALAIAGTATALGGLAVGAFKAGVEFNTLNQKANASFETILGSAEAAAQMMGDLTAFAKTSPFPRQAFIKASQQMLAFGIESQKVIPYLGAIQDAVAAAGGGAQQLQEVSFVLSQISAAGKITGQDLIQLGQRGINAAELIGSQMGKTGPEIKKAITDGALGADEALDALTKGMTEKFGGAAASVKETWVGAVDRIKGAYRDIGAILAAPFIDPEGGGLAVEWANQVADLMRAIEPIVKAVTDAIMQNFAGSFGAVGGILGTITEALKGVDVASVVSTLGEMAPTLAAVAAAALAFTGSFGAGLPVIGPLLSGLASPLGIVLAAITALVATSPELQAVFGGVMQQALAALTPAVQAIGGAFQLLSPVLVGLVAAIAPLVSIFAGVLSQTIVALVPVIIQLVAAIAPLAEILIGAFAQALTLIAPLITTLLGAIAPLIPMVAGALAPILSALVDVFLMLIPPIVSLVGSIFPPLVEIVTVLLQAFAPLIPPIVSLAGQLIMLAVRAVEPLVPVLLTLVRAFLPLIPPIAQIIGLAIQILQAFMPIVEIVITLASVLVGKLLAALEGPLKSVIGAMVTVLEKVADAFQWVVDKVKLLADWFGRLKMPSWLSSIGDTLGGILGMSASVPLSVTTTARTATVGGTTALGASPRASVNSGGGVMVTVNAPYGGGEAIGRAIRAELVKLDRRRSGVSIGGPDPRAVFG